MYVIKNKFLLTLRKLGLASNVRSFWDAVTMQEYYYILEDEDEE
jgi:hypothetical protein